MKMQEELQAKEYEATAGGGVITASMWRQPRTQVSITIDPEAVDPDDVEMLQDMIVAAVNEAMRKAEADQSANMAEADGRPEFRRPVLMRAFPAALERLTEQFAQSARHRYASRRSVWHFMCCQPAEGARRRAFAQAITGREGQPSVCCPVCQNLTDQERVCDLR